MKSKKKTNFKEIVLEHRFFLGAMVLFLGFASYSLLSFFSSTNSYIDSVYVSVSESDEVGLKNGETFAEQNRNVGLVEMFSDMNENHVNAQAVSSLYAAGIVHGYEDMTFKPDNLINRAELLVVLTTALDIDFSGDSFENCFSDVKDEWFSTFVCYARNEGWIGGYADGSYKPSRAVSKAEALKIAFEAFGHPVCDEVSEKPFEDVELDSWYAPYACAARRDELIDLSGGFDAGHQVTRAEFSQIVYNVMVSEGLI